MNVATAVVRCTPGATRSDVHRVRGAGPLRILCPRAAGNAAWLVTSSLGGGLVDGDHIAFEVEVDAGATCLITTQASSKVYKGTTSQRTSVRVHGDGIALVVPDPVVPYRDASFTQRTELSLDASSSLVLCDVITAGRVAFGERWSATRLDTLLTIDLAGSRILHDRVLLADEVALRMRRFEAIATIVLLGPRVTDLAASLIADLGTTKPDAPLLIAGSPLADGALLRLAGENIEAVVATTRVLLGPACARFGEQPWARKW